VLLKATGLNVIVTSIWANGFALEGDTLIAHGTNAREVYLAARQAGIAGPYIVHITPKAEAYIGGW
jgi:hypothetical protein